MNKSFRIVSVLVVLAMVLGAASAGNGSAFAKNHEGGPGAPAGKGQANSVYIVQMAEEPVVAYKGGIGRLKATAPRPGEKINLFSAAVVDYVAYLDGRHDQAVAKVNGRKIYDYRFTFNGFAAELTGAQAEALKAESGVLSVYKDELHEVDTSSTPSFLGLDAPGGLWEQLGGIGRGGENIVIGIVDSGIWPESLSFSDRTGTNGNGSKDGKLDYQQIPGWNGKCTPGEDFNASMCNQKLIGAQYFNAAWGGNAAIEAQRPWEFTSPRDYNGHGTHTASTAGGNYNTPTTGPAAAFGPISGMAPRARISSYKALWSTEDGSTASGFTSDLVAAIDQAVADGVDVINYSISGSRTDFLYPVMVSFLFAADAGVFVAASAGNSGPSSSTVAHAGPWVTTVAAGTHNRAGEGSVTLGDGSTYYGASVATSVGPAPLIDSSTAGLPGANPTEVNLCYPGTLDPAVVSGKIVVCDRGVIARVDKSLAVAMAGGVGSILLNTSASSLNADFHFVPTVHLAHTDKPAVDAYTATAGATATINAATITYSAPAPLTASFSSRGPLLAGGGDLLKPDLIAPGVDILAAVAPPANAGRDFNLYSGTSMSSPHVAGLAALLMDRHPDWTPMMIKSALMTSAGDVLDGPNTHPLVIFRQGAGHVRPNSAANPGLVFDAGWLDWLAFLCGTTNGVSAGTCAALTGMGYSLDPSDYNSASIAIGDLPGSQTVTRRVTNVSGGTHTYNASYTGLAGFGVTISPASLTLAPGETKSFSVSFTRTTAPLNAYTGGQISWVHGPHTVRVPVVVRPIEFSAPAQVSSDGSSIVYGVNFGYDGAFSATARGLEPATTFDGSVVDDPTDTFVPGGPGTVSFDFVVPAGTTYARFSLFDANVSPASDLDLYVYRGSTQVGGSGSGTSQEEVNLVNPAADTYTVWVHGWGVSAPSASFTLFAWALGSADAGNMTITAPAAAVVGPGLISLDFSGLAAGTKYLGSVAYSGMSGATSPTIVRVDTP